VLLRGPGPPGVIVPAFAGGAVAVLVTSISLRWLRRMFLLRAAGALIAAGQDAAIIADDSGRPLALNDAARERRARGPAGQGDAPGQALSVAAFLAHVLADPAQTVAALQAEAGATGSACEEMMTRHGPLHVSAARLGHGLFLWRLASPGAAPAARDEIGLPCLTAGPDGTVLYMNAAFRRLVGRRACSLDDIFTDLPLESGRRHVVQAAGGPRSCLVARTAGADGRCEVYLLPGVGGADVDWDGIGHLPIPLLLLAPDGLVRAANREARALLPMEIGSGTRFSDLVEGPGRPVSDWVRDAAEGRGSDQAQFLRGSGSHRDLFLRVTLSPGGRAETRHVLAILADVTDYKMLEAQFVQSQKMEAIGQLAGGIAHDFNNLLTAISGHCDLLLLRRDETDPDWPDLAQIRQNANRAAGLVSQLLAFSRKQSLVPEVIDLRDTLADLTHLLNRLVGEKVHLVLEHDPALKPIRADRRQLEQVIMNLVVNARDAMPGGGEIRIETANRHLDGPYERDRARVPAGDHVTVRVIDRGAGIAPERMPMIFEPFYTTKRVGEGTGLGLSTAYGIVKQTGGFIFADSMPGEGTTFSLWFPASRERLQPATSPPESVLSRVPGGGVVLLVEDEAPVRAFAARALRLRGHQVLEADSAEAALALLADPGLRVDVFLSDVVMPGKDGPTWVREALADRPGTRVIFVSGYAADGFADHRALIPGAAFLPKPFSLTDLAEAVQQQLQWPQEDAA